MLRMPPLLVLVGCGALAGCADEPAPARADIEAALITPGAWVVNGAPDHILVWAHNKASTPVSIRWHLEFANGTDLPAAWALQAERADVSLAAAGTKSRIGGQVEYPDWAWTLFTINIPEGTPAGEHPLVLDTGKSRHGFTLRIAENQTRVSHPNDHVELEYDGKFQSTGRRFDQGSFDTRLGSGDTVPGFDYGLMGLGLGEQATLMIPAALGYGYDNTHRDYVAFNGQTLRFDVKILRFL